MKKHIPVKATKTTARNANTKFVNCNNAAAITNISVREFYSLTRGQKKRIDLRCKVCGHVQSHDVSHAANRVLSCPVNPKHEMFSLSNATLEIANPGSKWETNIAKEFVLSKKLQSLISRYPFLANAEVKNGGTFSPLWKFEGGFTPTRDANGDWDVMVYFPILKQIVGIDVDSVRFHRGNEVDDGKKNDRGTSLFATIRIRPTGLPSVYPLAGTPPTNHIEILDAFSEKERRVDFTNAVDAIIDALEFFAQKIIFEEIAELSAPDARKFLKDIEKIHGHRYHKLVKNFYQAATRKVQGENNIRLSTQHPSVYKAYYDNAFCSNWRSIRVIRYSQILLAGWVREFFQPAGFTS